MRKKYGEEMRKKAEWKEYAEYREQDNNQKLTSFFNGGDTKHDESTKM